LFAIYTEITNKLYLIPLNKDTPTGKFALRLYPPKKKYTKKIWLAEDYEADKIFNLL